MALGINSNSGVKTGESYSNRPLVRMISNDEINKNEKDREEERRKAEEVNNSQTVSSLGGHIRSSWEAAVWARTTVSERILASLRQRDGKYDAETLQMIRKQAGTEIFMSLTDTKCRALEAWLNDLMLPSGEKPYSVEPTPVPELPNNITDKAERMFLEEFYGRVKAQAEQAGFQFHESMINKEELQEEWRKAEATLLARIREQAKEDADYLETHIDDELREGGWYKTISSFISDFATYPTAFVQGPIYRKRLSLQWEPVEGEIKSNVKIVEKVVKEYERIAPYDVYPSPGSKSIHDGDLCIRHRYSRADLAALRGVEGYNSSIIDIILDKYASGYKEYLSYDSEYENLHDRFHEQQDPYGHIEGIKFWGNVQGKKLWEWGLTVEQIPDPYREYPVIAHMVGNYVFGAKLNPHPLGRRNIYAASFRKKNDSVWGRSVPELMRDVQNMCNSLARAMANNAAFASGPQVSLYSDLIPPECKRTQIFPHKIWEFSAEKVKNAGLKPVEFYQPPLIATQLLKLYEYFFQQGSEVTGIPSYIYGNENVGGAGQTASGLSMLMNAAAKGLRNAAKNIDDGIISPSVEEHWLVLMLTRPDLARGDTKIIARASDYLIQAEALQMRRNEFLATTNNPTDLNIIGIDGRSELLRENVKALKMQPDKIVPPREDMISNQVDQKLQEMIGQLSQALDMPPEQLMAILQSPGPGPGGGQQQPRSQAQNAAGGPVAGQEVRQFNG